MNNLSGEPANWFYVLDSRRQGPFERATLIRELLSLDAPEGVLVWRTGLLAWTKAGALDELKRELPPPVPGALVMETPLLGLPICPRTATEKERGPQRSRFPTATSSRERARRAPPLISRRRRSVGDADATESREPRGCRRTFCP